MIYYTADQHFGHENIIRLCGRPFMDVNEMDEALIFNWNCSVSNEDTVYILGDLIFRSSKAPSYYLERLNGKKHLVLGNHDHKWISSCALNKYFSSVTSYLEIKDKGKRIALCHYPMLSWGGIGRESYHFFGHIHNNREGLAFETIQRMDHAFNAGVEINGYAPVTLEELIVNNEKFNASNT